MKKVKNGAAPITWQSKKVKVSLIKPTPNNYKIKTDLGTERLQQSLKLFGLAGTVVCNTDLSLIDGNSRLVEAKEKGLKEIWVSVPNRKLTPKEYKEMAAMYDVAKAGEVDMERIKGELGTTADFYKKWGIEMPMELLEKMGSKVDVGELEYPGSKKGKGGKEELDLTPTKDICMVNLFFSVKEEEWFRKMEDKHSKAVKADDTTSFVLKSLKKLYGSK